MLDRDPNLLTVTDLKQYDYCARILFYERCLPDFRPRTYKMDAGREAHEEESRLAARRTFHKLGLVNGERYFDVRLQSEQLGLDGIVDEIIVTQNPSAAYPVDYKLARQVSHHYKVQLAAYASLIEESWQLPTPWGYIYLIAQRKAEKVSLDSMLRTEAEATLVDIRQIIVQERMPPPTKQRSKCANCEFRRICNDV